VGACVASDGLFEEDQSTCLKRSSNALRAWLGLRLSLRTGLALDRHPRRKQMAGIADVFRRDAYRDRLCALEALTRVERLALRARVKVSATSRAPRLSGNRVGEHVTATGASHHLVETGHVRRAPLERLPLGLVGTGFDSAVAGRLRGDLRDTRRRTARAT
jgi:hypothetical protein